ncbi:MAG: DNA alkylation repair protein [Deltaproteobacteria bacterium]|nr:DNA alkylation repair protein [Deltaproteobacteria bacterium]
MDLWATGNGDARVLATMIADPAAADAKLLEAWAKDLEYYVLADCLARYLLANHPNAQKFMEKWTRSKDEWIGRAGWMTLAVIAGTLDEPDAYFDGYLQTIEKKIHGSKNRVKDAMIRALIAIALRGDKLEKKAVAAAKAIGKVDVDHGETHCVTPDPIPYIAKAKKRKKK